jgi:hypothetical protein
MHWLPEQQPAVHGFVVEPGPHGGGAVTQAWLVQT